MADEEIKLQRKFPAAFPVGVPPKGAREAEIVVYRVCRTGKVEKESFLPTYLDPATKENSAPPYDCGHYSMSTFENMKKAKSILRWFKKRNPPAILARGVTAPECGLVLRDKEMLEIDDLKECIQGKDIKKMRKESHVHWWLYEGAEPHRFFQPFEEKEEST